MYSVQHSNRIKDKKKKSDNLNRLEKKMLEKICFLNLSFHDKNTQQSSNRKFLNLIKSLYEKPTADILNGEGLEALP